MFFDFRRIFISLKKFKSTSLVVLGKLIPQNDAKVVCVCVTATGLHTIHELWGRGVPTSDRGSQRPRLCAFPWFIFNLTNAKVRMPVTRKTKIRIYNGHIYWPPFWNLGSYVLWPFCKINYEAKMTMEWDSTIKMTTDNNVR